MMKLAIFTGALAIATPFGFAQETKNATYQVRIDVDKPKFEELKSPEFSTDTETKTWDQKDWLEMEVKFNITDIKPVPRDETLPKLLVKWYVVAVDPVKGGKNYIRLEKEIEHVNVPVGEDIYTSCYISPSGVRRLSGGGDKASKRIIFGVGGEFHVNGEVVAYFASKDDKVKVDGKKLPFWYSSALSASNSVQIHDKNDTPFKFLWWDRYAEIAPEEKK